MARLVSPLRLLLVLIIQLNWLCSAQVTQVFQWTFTATAQQISSSLTQCQTYAISVSPLNSSTAAVGTAPYYMLVFPSGGFPTTSFIGTDPKNLSWRVNHAAGTQLLLGMTDSTGVQSGGTATSLYTVSGSAAGDTSCMPSAPTTSLAVIGNVTKDLSTCKPWGLRVSGGTPPYNITLAAVGSPVVTNISLPSGDDVFTWIDRASPNTQILAAVTDASGQWGNSTVLVNTVGSSDYTCTGLVSKAGNSSQIPFYYTAPSDTKRRIIGVAVGVSLGSIAVIVGTVLVVLYMRRQSRRERGIEDGQDTLPRVFGNLGGTDYAADPFPAQSNTSSLANKRMMSQLMIGSPGSTSSGPNSTSATSPSGIVRYNHSRHSSSSIDRPLPAVPLHSPRPNSRDSASTSPLSPSATRHYTKAAEAQARLTGGAEDVQPQAERSGAASNHRPFSRDGNIGADIIIQHRDGGVVQELPPPYLDRSTPATTTRTQ
jgi:hypothetical protein